MKKANLTVTVTAMACLAILFSTGCAYDRGSHRVATPPQSVLQGPITNSANGHTYYLLKPTTWTASETAAVLLGGHLVTINDQTENRWVFERFSSPSGTDRLLWLGLNDASAPSKFVWSSGEPAVYLNWAPGQPDAGEHYVYMHPANAPKDRPRPPGTWNNYSDGPTEYAEKVPIYGIVEVVPSR